MPSTDPLFVGIDVGTGSARAGVFDAQGHLLASAEHPIQTFRVEGQPLLYQQSSEDIWRALQASLTDALARAGDSAGRVAGLSVTATCSIVVMMGTTPVDVTPTGASVIPNTGGEETPNIIMWLDHRALEEAEAITQTGHPLLRHVGGVISPENEIPKLRWLKTHRPDIYRDASTRYYDLADYLSLRLAGQDGGHGSAPRSLCCVGAKWMYDSAEGRWDPSFLQAIGLDDLSDAQLGATVESPGEALGRIDPALAAVLGIPTSAIVAIGTVDAFAGLVGSVGAQLPDSHNVPLQNRLAVIMGTSTCHLCLSTHPHFVRGVWGPFRDAVGNGMWVAEGGQSATGKLLDHVLTTHPAWGELQAEAAAAGQHPQQYLHSRLEATAAAANHSNIAFLARDIHVLPHWAGSRSPEADPELTGAIVGLTFDVSLAALSRLYLATVQALALGTKRIVDALERGGHGAILLLFISGGLGVKNRVLLKAHADATGRVLVLPGGSDEAVLLGAAVVAAVAAGTYPSIDAGMAGMTEAGEMVVPDPDLAVRALYQQKEVVYGEMMELQRRARARAAPGEG